VPCQAYQLESLTRQSFREQEAAGIGLMFGIYPAGVTDWWWRAVDLVRGP